MTVPPRPIITLATDFGTTDAYVAAMKGVILDINPEVTLIDITHDISPQNITQASYILSTAWPYFPLGSIHVAVIDPGVGSERRAILIAGPGGYYIGPDNGSLSAMLPDTARPPAVGLIDLPAGYQAISLTNPAFFRPTVSNTFHGRDIFAPVAAHLSRGVALTDFGETIDAIVALPPLRAHRSADGSLHGRIVHIDRFGNLITDVRMEDIPTTDETVAVIYVAGRSIRGISRHYQAGPDLLALIGSSGYLEIAWRNGSAARLLHVGIGDEIVVRMAR